VVNHLKEKIQNFVLKDVEILTVSLERRIREIVENDTTHVRKFSQDN